MLAAIGLVLLTIGLFLTEWSIHAYGLLPEFQAGAFFMILDSLRMVVAGGVLMVISFLEKRNEDIRRKHTIVGDRRKDVCPLCGLNVAKDARTCPKCGAGLHGADRIEK